MRSTAGRLRTSQQELSQRFGLPFGLALRVSSVLSHLCAASARLQSEPSPVSETPACVETAIAAAASAADAASDDAEVKLEAANAAEADVKSIPDGVGLGDDTEPHPLDKPNPTALLDPTPTEIPAAPTLSDAIDQLVASNPTGSGESELAQQPSPVLIDSTWELYLHSNNSIVPLGNNNLFIFILYFILNACV